MSRRPAQRSPRRSPVRNGLRSARLWMGVCGGLVLAGLVGVGMTFAPPRAEDANGCVEGQAHRTLAIAVDTTDNLLAGEPRESRQAIVDALASLKPNDRVVVVEMSGTSPTEAAPLVDACLPGDETNIERNRLRDRVWKPIDARLKQLSGQPAAKTSPLIETVLVLASDRLFNGPTSRLTVLMITDGLQNSSFASAYRGGTAFPPPAGYPLQRVSVVPFIVRNPRDAALQPRGTAALAEWLRRAGASVSLDQPPWMSVISDGVHARR